VLVFLLFIPSAINNNTKNIYTPFGADLTIQVSVKPNIILDFKTIGLEVFLVASGGLLKE
jgi:hypothetical protein